MRDNHVMHGTDRLIVVTAKFISFISKTLGFGAGETWPGEVALRLRPHIAQSLARSLSRGCILVAGTNGKTTTSLMIKKTLEGVGNVVIHNETGANLLNGIVSSFIRHADFLGRITADVGIFEVDENSLPHVLRYMTPTHLVFLNLFRDQLDRYGEVDVIVEKWTKAIGSLTPKTTLIINADDPGVASLGKASRAKAIYFGITDTKKFSAKAEHATDSTFCPQCGHRLSYKGIFFSHLGIWRCPSCGNSRPAPSVHSWPSALPGLYNEYNTLAAVATARAFGEPQKNIREALSRFTPAFGRQEEITADGRTVKIFLSKNPAGFNASLRTVTEMKAAHLLVVLNDRIPDGRDVSWIWDVDFEMIPDAATISVSGDRCLDMAVRLKYADKRVIAEQDVSEAVTRSIAQTPKGQTLYVLATYSGMLEVRKILTGRKIL